MATSSSGFLHKPREREAEQICSDDVKEEKKRLCLQETSERIGGRSNSSSGPHGLPQCLQVDRYNLRLLSLVCSPALDRQLLLPAYNTSLPDNSRSSWSAVRWFARDCHLNFLCCFRHLLLFRCFVVGREAETRKCLHLNLHCEAGIS